MLKLGLLDFGNFNNKQINSQQALNNLFELVPAAEKMGYTRYWLAEHYEYGVAWRNPDLLVGLLCGLTDKIKVGPAGILLHLYSPLKVAQNYKMLEYLFSGRIDLGLAKGVTEKHIMKALLDTKELQLSKDSYKRHVEEVFQFLRGNFPESHPHSKIRVPPDGTFEPEVWILGSGSGSYPMAIQHKAAFCLSIFHRLSNERGGGRAAYMRDFRRSYEEVHGQVPQSTICVAGACAERQEQAKAALNQHNPIREIVDKCVIGTPESCMEQLLELQQQYQVDEIIFLDLTLQYEARLESIGLLAEATKIAEIA